MLYDRWQTVVRHHARELALMDPTSGRRWTFGELDAAVNRVDLSPEPVVRPTGNGPEFILTVLAAWRSGRAVLPCEVTASPDLEAPPLPNPRLRDHPLLDSEWRREFPEPQVRALYPVTDGRAGLLPPSLPPGLAPGRQESRPSGYWAGPGRGGTRFEGENAIRPSESENSPTQSNFAPAHLKSTSGTTGASQLIAFTAEQLAADADHIVATMGLRPDQPNLGVISLAHSYGFSNLVTPLLLHGIPLVLCPSPMPEAVKAAASGFASLALPAVPAMWRAWHDGNAIPANVRLAISAGAPLPLELETAVFSQRGLKLHNFYGSSECGGIAYDDSSQPRSEAALAGRPLHGVSLSLGDDGCLVVQSAAVGLGYVDGNGDRLGNGRFLTSDMAELRTGQVFLRGRATDIINVAGRKLSPEVVESVIKGQPGVRECVVTGVPAREASRGEEVLAILVLEAGAGLETVRSSVTGSLSAWQFPRHWWVVPEINVSQRGKISRREWRERYLASLQR